MSGTVDDDGERMPNDDELEEPSTEKEPAEAPKDPEGGEADADHRAVGIGIVEGADDPGEGEESADEG